MANQPGYQVPGQSNTAPQDSGSYNQNQIMGAGYGTGQGFFGGPQTAQSQQAQGANQGFTPMLGSQFQAPQLGQFNPQLGAPPPSPQTTFQGDLSGEKPSGQEFTQPSPGYEVPTQATPTTYAEAKALAQDPNSGVTEVPGSRGYSGSPTYQYVDANGEMVYINPSGVIGDAPQQMTFEGLGGYQSPTEQYRQAVMARDVTTPIQQALRSQLQGLAAERGQAVQQLQSQQRGLGMSGLAGLDLAGVGRQYAETAGDIRTGAMNAREAARRAKAAEVFNLGAQARQEAGAAMAQNRDFALSQIDMLQSDAQNLTGGGNTVMANQNLVNELRQLSNLAMTRAVNVLEFNALVSELMGRYGSYALVAPDGAPMGSSGFELQGNAPKM